MLSSNSVIPILEIYSKEIEMHIKVNVQLCSLHFNFIGKIDNIQNVCIMGSILSQILKSHLNLYVPVMRFAPSVYHKMIV